MITSDSIYKIIVKGQAFGIVDSSNLAPIEETQYASQPYNAGNYLIFNGVLCIASRSISAGATLVIGESGNLTAVQVGSEMLSLKDQITRGLEQVNQRIDDYRIPVADADTVGGVKIGDGISIDENGRISTEGYALPTASTNQKGGVKVSTGAGVYMNGENLYLATASPTQKGGIKVPVDSEYVGLYISGEMLMVNKASKTQLGSMKAGYGLTSGGDGVINLQSAKKYNTGDDRNSIRGGVYIDDQSGLTVDSDGELNVKIKSAGGLIRDENGIYLKDATRSYVDIPYTISGLSPGAYTSGYVTLTGISLGKGFVEGMTPLNSSKGEVTYCMAVVKQVVKSGNNFNVHYVIHNMSSSVIADISFFRFSYAYV